METRVKIVIMSHLSDLQMISQIERGTKSAEHRYYDTWIRTEFIKYLMNQYPDQEVYFDPDKAYEAFTEIPRVKGYMVELYKTIA